MVLVRAGGLAARPAGPVRSLHHCVGASRALIGLGVVTAVLVSLPLSLAGRVAAALVAVPVTLFLVAARREVVSRAAPALDVDWTRSELDAYEEARRRFAVVLAGELGPLVIVDWVLVATDRMAFVGPFSVLLIGLHLLGLDEVFGVDRYRSAGVALAGAGLVSLVATLVSPRSIVWGVLASVVATGVVWFTSVGLLGAIARGARRAGPRARRRR